MKWHLSGCWSFLFTGLYKKSQLGLGVAITKCMLTSKRGDYEAICFDMKMSREVVGWSQSPCWLKGKSRSVRLTWQMSQVSPSDPPRMNPWISNWIDREQHLYFSFLAIAFIFTFSSLVNIHWTFPSFCGMWTRIETQSGIICLVGEKRTSLYV